jgi:catechol 2,3-dioxygenase-like lactoylglutathione lyase family enzyme
VNGFRVTQIDHIELFVPDRYEAAAWYARTLGLEIVPEYEHWAAAAESPLMIATRLAQTKLALFAGEPRGARPTAGFHRVAFRVDRQGFDAFRAHVHDNPVFNERGEEVRELAVSDHGQALSVYFCDPYGHRLEVTTYDV